MENAEVERGIQVSKVYSTRALTFLLSKIAHHLPIVGMIIGNIHVL